ncbi:MAG: phosphatase PAP2 family protein [Lachnospiraceae bacterium]|nr:phosphatase PAP2 family protein [Lachnospiraceae bacterium]
MEWLQNLDATILLFIQEHLRVEALHWFWKGITFLGNAGWFWVVLGLILLIPRKTRKVGIMALVSIFVCFLFTNVMIKNLVARPRPYVTYSEIYPLIKKPTEFSFPSGHACVSFASAFIYFRMLPRKYGVSAIVLAGLIAFSRLYVGVHYPGDVLGGIIVAWVGSTLVYWFMHGRKKVENGKSGTSQEAVS